MKKFFVASLVLVLCVCAQAAKKPTPKLVFDASKGVAGSVTLPTGKKVNYTAYTNLYYVTHVEDSTYQYMNVFASVCYCPIIDLDHADMAYEWLYGGMKPGEMKLPMDSRK